VNDGGNNRTGYFEIKIWTHAAKLQYSEKADIWSEKVMFI